MDAIELKKRTREFAFQVIKLVESLPNNWKADVIGKQLLRCGTSVVANELVAILTASAITARKNLVKEG